MALYTFQTITSAQAAGYSASADSLSFGDGAANRVSVAYLAAPEQVAIALDGVTMNFGPGVYGDTDLGFTNGGMVYIGGGGADNATGTANADGLFGGAGGDTLNGGDGSDLLQGNQGADSMVGGGGDDSVFGGQDNDVIVLGAGAGERNWSNGNKGDDFITGAAGSDTILGGQGNDNVVGGGGGDLLDGNLGDDTIVGGAAPDTILGEGGYDVMTGGGGADTFVFAAGSSEVNVATADRILDWSQLYHISLPSRGGYTEIVAQPAPTMPGGGDPYGYGYGAGVEGYGAGLTVDDFSAAQVAANTALGANTALRVVAAQAGSDVVAFIDSDGDHAADLAIILMGVTLDSIDASNFV